jgi:hypothetical protein
MAIAPLIERVRGFDSPLTGSHDFATPVGGRWCAIDPSSTAPDLTNFEYVRQSLALQAIIGAPHQTEHGYDQIERRTALLQEWVPQAAVKNSFDIIINYIANVAVPEEDHESDAATFGRPVFNFYYFQVPDRGWRGNADSAQAYDCPNLTQPSSDTDNPPGLETSDPYNTGYYMASPVRDGNDGDE